MAVILAPFRFLSRNAFNVTFFAGGLFTGDSSIHPGERLVVIRDHRMVVGTLLQTSKIICRLDDQSANARISLSQSF
jgi:hypothetical protein